MSKVIVVGAGINGVTAAIELKKRGHKVTLVDPGPLPHPLYSGFYYSHPTLLERERALQ